MTFTPEGLQGMSDKAFAEALTEDLNYVAEPGSPFQDECVVDRTLAALGKQIWQTRSTLDRASEDLETDAGHVKRIARFLHHLMGTTDQVEKGRFGGSAIRSASEWQRIVRRLLEEIEGDEVFDELLDEIHTPRGGSTLRTWLEIRRRKSDAWNLGREVVKEAA